ncbi:MAG TPA: HAD family hydrolase [Polyangiaceae bacterium]|nr:HAD family hydrolase [Polyangiaceae bacterium]
MLDRSYAAWLIDLDGTLYHKEPVRLAMAAELAIAGWGAIPTLRAFRKQHEQRRQATAGTQLDPYRQQLQATAAHRGTSEEKVQAIVNRWMFERPLKWLSLCKRRSLLTQIAEYRTQGGRTALVSDYPAQAKLLALGARELFDAVIASGEEGGPQRLKPDPQGYLLASQALHIAPERCLVIGDRDDADGQAARSASMAFALIR